MTDFSLPVPHIYEDGSVDDIRVVSIKGTKWLAIRDGEMSVVITNAAHARRLAQALLIAASLLEK